MDSSDDEVDYKKLLDSAIRNMTLWDDGGKTKTSNDKDYESNVERSVKFLNFLLHNPSDSLTNEEVAYMLMIIKNLGHREFVHHDCMWATACTDKFHNNPELRKNPVKTVPKPDYSEPNYYECDIVDEFATPTTKD